MLRSLVGSEMCIRDSPTHSHSQADLNILVKRRIQDLERGFVTSFPSPSFPFPILLLFPSSLSSPTLPLTTLPFPSSPSLHSSFPLSCPFPSLGPSPFPAMGSGESCKLPQWCSGRRPGRKRILVYLAPRKRAWWQAFRSFLCDTKCSRQSMYYCLLYTSPSPRDS